MARSATGPVTSKRMTYGIKVNHLPHDITKEQVSTCFQRYGSIASISLKPGDNECYAFVNFYSNSCAQTASKEMNGTLIGGKRINCHAQVRGSANEGRSSSVGEYTVKVTYISKCTNDDTLSSVFGFGDGNKIHSIKIVPCPTDPTNFAYINYFSQSDAERAVSSLDQQLVDGSKVRVKMHQTTHRQSATLPQASSPEPQYCPSLPVQSHVSIIGNASPNTQVRTCTSPSYIRSHSAISQPAKPVGNSIHSTAVRRHFSQPQPGASNPMCVLNTGGTQSCTVKVSIYGELSSDDIGEVFSQFGEIRETPVIRPGDPNFSYVNFSSPEAAANACCIHNSTVKGIRVEVKVSQKQRSTSTSDQTYKAVQCTSLVASILQTKHKEELESLKSEHQVSLKPSSSCIKVCGEKEQVTAVEVCLQRLMKKLEEDISVKDCELPCHSVPLFEQYSAIQQFQNIEASHGVEFCVLKTLPESTSVDLGSFYKEVKECFTPEESRSPADAIPMCSDLAAFLKEKPQKLSSSKTDKTMWLWQNDSGSGFASYTPEVSSKLSRAFADSPSGSTSLEIGSYEYTINFSKMTQTNITSGRSRPIMQTASNNVCVQWFYRDDGKVYVPYTAVESAEIEQMFQSNTPSSLVIEGNIYTFDFASMTQCNLVSKNMRKIERRVEVNKENHIPNTERVITVQARGVPPSLEPALKELEDTVARATIEKECQLHDSSSSDFKIGLIKNMNKYFVTADIVDECLQLKGMPRYVERVSLIAELEKISDREQHVRKGVEMVPPDWEPQSRNLHLSLVKRGSDVWDTEVKRIRKTLSGATIVKLERIQNKWLWERYSFAKNRLSQTNKGNVNEKHLFHGTRDTPPEKVFKSEKGVDFRFSRAGMWGTGSYFAVNASYSDVYAYTAVGIEKKMFIICKVLTGESYNAKTSDNSLRQPPLKPVATHESFEEERYDSVKGHTNGSDIYIVYDHEKVYPAYLVTYY